MKPAIRNNSGFTLIEIMVASIAAVLILTAIYGIFSRAMKMRDNATVKIREMQLKARAVNVIRNDVRNALVSGGILAATLQGDSTTTDGSSNFPGYLKMTTTTGKDTPDEMYGDVQQVEYYVIREPGASGTGSGGTLERIITRDLLDTNPNVIHVEDILAGVESFHVSFYDGSTWQPSWLVSGTGSSSGSTASTASSTTATSGSTNTVTLPQAIRIEIQQAAPAGRGEKAPAPVEIVIPWTTAPFLSGTNYIIGSGTNE